MPSVSKSQQRFFGQVHAYQTGKLKNASDAVKKAAKNINKKDAKDFAETSLKGLPDKVGEMEDEMEEEELSLKYVKEHLYNKKKEVHISKNVLTWLYNLSDKRGGF